MNVISTQIPQADISSGEFSTSAYSAMSLSSSLGLPQLVIPSSLPVLVTLTDRALMAHSRTEPLQVSGH
jgi:hypothetical protein